MSDAAMLVLSAKRRPTERYTARACHARVASQNTSALALRSGTLSGTLPASETTLVPTSALKSSNRARRTVPFTLNRTAPRLTAADASAPREDCCPTCSVSVGLMTLGVNRSLFLKLYAANVHSTRLLSSDCLTPASTWRPGDRRKPCWFALMLDSELTGSEAAAYCPYSARAGSRS